MSLYCNPVHCPVELQIDMNMQIALLNHQPVTNFKIIYLFKSYNYSTPITLPLSITILLFKFFFIFIDFLTTYRYNLNKR